MVSPIVNNQSLPQSAFSVENQITQESQGCFLFQTHFQGYMEMYSNVDTVGEYLKAHEGWFTRCALPMKARPLGDNGYTLIIGRFGSFGYEVEPKISVVLLPPQDNIYLMHSISVPDDVYLGYDVDYQARMELKEIPLEAAKSQVSSVFKNQPLPLKLTQVTWELHLGVSISFPRFIYKLPNNLIQTTGDRLLAQIVRQVSPRLTYKVQQDFHTQQNLPIPPKSSRSLQRITQNPETEDEEC